MRWADIGIVGAALIVGAAFGHFQRRRRHRTSVHISIERSADVDEEAGDKKARGARGRSVGGTGTPGSPSDQADSPPSV